jgi:hypothetical protein
VTRRDFDGIGFLGGLIGRGRKFVKRLSGDDMEYTVLVERSKTTLACIFICLALCHATWVAAQDVTPPAVSAKDHAAAVDAVTPARRIEESFPSIYYLKDEQGKLQAVPNFTLQEFEDLFKLKNQLVQGDPRPRFSIQQMLASGKVNSAGQADLVVRFRVFIREDHWTRIPLRLDQAVLREPAQYQGPGEHLLAFDREGEGYVAWIHGPAGQTHELTLKLLVPLTGTGQETRLRLTAPRTTASELRLKVPYAKATARASEEATLQSFRDGDRETELVAVGLNGDFELDWHPPNVAGSKPPTLEASGTILSRIDGRGVETEAAFSVRSYGETFDRFHIRMPPETDLVPGNPSGYTLTAVEVGGGTAGFGRQRVVEVRLAHRTAGPVDIHFSTKRAANTTRPGRSLELAGFEIPEAARQGGTIVVSVAGDWQVVWGANRGVRQIDQTPEALRQKDVVAVYEYFALPSSLTARLVTRKTRINVEPEYVILVDSDQVRLEARLRYTVRGAKVTTVDIAMPDWQIDEVGPDNVVTVDGVPDTAGMSLALPLVSPTAGQFEVRLKAHRALAANAKSFSVTLPQPQVGAPAAAVVAVVPADNVEIVPQFPATSGLLRQQVPVMPDLPLRQQEPLFYRTDAPNAVFAAELRRHHQRTAVSVNSQLTIEPGGPRVEQKFSYTIAYEPTDYCLLEVPRELAGNGRLELSCEDQALTPVVLGDASDPGAPGQRVRVGLPKSLIGHYDLTARYALPPGRESGGDIHVPLVMPLDAELVGNTLTVVPSEEQQLEVVGGGWATVDDGTAVSATTQNGEFSNQHTVSEVVLKHGGDASNSPVVVERAWLQTRLPALPDARRDRLVLQLVTRRRQLDVGLPPGAVREQAAVRLFRLDRDRSTGKTPEELPVAAALADNGDLAVHLPAGIGARRYVLCLDYQVVSGRTGQGSLPLAFPRLDDGAWVSQMYWQVLLPPEEHLASSPRDFTEEFVWRWNNLYYGRQPMMSQAELEAWVGLPPLGGLPAEAGMNSYLFSTLGWPDSCEIVTVGRSMIVLAASGAALLAGLALIYLRAARHPVILLAASIVLAGGAAIRPELAILAAQAAVLGLVLALIALVLRKWLAAERPIALPEVSSAATMSLHVSRPSEPPVAVAPPTGSSKAPSLPLATEAVP